MKKEELRGFDVFFGFGREEKCAKIIQAERKNLESSWVERKFQKNVSPPVWGVPGAIYNPGYEN